MAEICDTEYVIYRDGAPMTYRDTINKWWGALILKKYENIGSPVGGIAGYIHDQSGITGEFFQIASQVLEEV